MKIFLKVKGFTLIELLVVIAIIGLLASIVIVSLNSSRAKGRDAKRISDIRTVQLALETYFNDNASYPSTIYSGTTGSTPSVAFQPYMATVPLDPYDNATQYKYASWSVNNATNCTGGTNNPAASSYHLGAGLEDNTNTGLKQDMDADPTPRATNTDCSSTLDFSGTGQTSGNACGTTAGTDACYDVTN